jgi:molybdopterin converting factor small subunit
MSVCIELFGIPRQCAGIDCLTADGARLGDVLLDLARQFPELAAQCLDRGRLRPGYLASLNGGPFVTDSAAPIRPGDSVLILSADAGG